MYELDDHLRPIRHEYLGDPEQVRKAIEAVAHQGKAAKAGEACVRQRFDDGKESRMKVGIVGTGFVGATAGYALVMQGVGREDRAGGQELRPAPRRRRMTFATPCLLRTLLRFGRVATRLWRSAASSCSALASGRSRERLACSFSNATRRSFARWCRQCWQTRRDAVLVVATNPVDVMTHLAARFAALCGVPPGRVLARVQLWTRPVSAVCSGATAASIHNTFTHTSSASTAIRKCSPGRWRLSAECL